MRCRCSSGRSTSTTSTSTTARIASTCRPISASAPARQTSSSCMRAPINGDMVPLDTVVRLRETTAPQVISHFNLFRSAEITGIRRAGRQLGSDAGGDGAAGAQRSCRRASTLRGRGSRSKRCNAGGAGRVDLRPEPAARLPGAGGAVREFVLPFIILLGVPLAVFGALGAQMLRGFNNDVFCQVGLVLLVGLVGEELDSDRRVRRAAARAGPVDRRRRDRVGAHPSAADSDDVVCVHPRRVAAGVGDAAPARPRAIRSARRSPAACWHRRSCRSSSSRCCTS